jgi:hypothetical protein
VADALRLVGDLTQAVVVAVIGYLVYRLVAGWFAPFKHERTLLGSSAAQTEKLGGTKSTAMQA